MQVDKHYASQAFRQSLSSPNDRRSRQIASKEAQMNVRRIGAFSIALSASALLPVVAVGQQPDEFRVETDVFAGDSKVPVSETLTLFVGDVIYDFLLTKPEEITILDVRRSRLVLLDRDRRVQTTLTMDKLQRITAGMKLVGEAEKKEIFVPEAAPQFDEETGEVVLQIGGLTYRALGIKPKQPAAARSYREFADWYARLNAARRLNLPPFARIALNRALSDRGLLPKKVSRTVVMRQQLVDKKTKAHSQHSFVWKLSNSDRKRIESAGTLQASFKAVSIHEYWQISGLARAR